MSDHIEDIEIEEDQPEIVAEEPNADQVAAENAAAIEALRSQIQSERDMRIAAQRQEQDAAARAAAAQTNVHETNLQLVTTAIANVKQTQAHLKSQLREAFASSDFEQAADIQAEMATAAANLAQLEHGKSAMEAAGPPKQAPPRPSDPVEQMASQMSAESAAWIRAHPDFVRDPRKFQRMVAAHNLAIGDDLTPDTPEYFAAIETTLRIRQPEQRQQHQEPEQQQESPMSQAAQPAQRRTQPSAAPVQSQSSPGNRNVMRLSAAEAEMASNLGMTTKEYAANKAKLIADGRLKA